MKRVTPQGPELSGRNRMGAVIEAGFPIALFPLGIRAQLLLDPIALATGRDSLNRS